MLPEIAEGDIFLHDGSSCHKLHVTKKFLTDEDIAALQNQSAQNHDFNIKKSIREKLKTQVYNRKPKGL